VLGAAPVAAEKMTPPLSGIPISERADFLQTSISWYDRTNPARIPSLKIQRSPYRQRSRDGRRRLGLI